MGSSVGFEANGQQTKRLLFMPSIVAAAMFSSSAGINAARVRAWGGRMRGCPRPGDRGISGQQAAIELDYF